jgi:hypothetical protein
MKRSIGEYLKLPFQLIWLLIRLPYLLYKQLAAYDTQHEAEENFKEGDES